MQAGVPPFAAPGEMAERCRAFDWASTALGPVEGWSHSLRSMAGAVLASRNPMLLFWGPELVQLYNDAFRPSLGLGTGPSARHPRALGMKASEFWTDVWDVVGPQIEGVMSRGDAVWHENLYLPIERDGRLDEAWWTYSYSPVRDDDGRIAGTLVVCIETTASVRAQRDLEAERARTAGILDAMADRYYVLDAEYRFTYVNESMVRTVGLARDEMLGKVLWDLFPGALGNEIERQYRRVATTGVDAHFMHDYSDGRLSLVAEIDLYPAADGGLAVFWRDVTQREHEAAERERLLAEADAARKAAEAANRAKGDFLAVMSHELRTPLNAIGGYAELIDVGVHGPVTPAQRQALERIQRSQRHLLGLINGVLNYAKVDAGAVSYAFEPLLLDDVLATCEALITPQARAKGLTVESAGCAPHAVVRADREKVQQILLNLLSNAVKFTEPGGRVTLSCERGDGDYLVRVSDTGQGIPTDRLESIFQPFVQVDARLTRTHEGVGLGLSISRDLARGMGGELTAANRAEGGSTFTLRLPAV